MHVNDGVYKSQLPLRDIGRDETGTNQTLEGCCWTSDWEALDGAEDLNTVGALKDVQFGICERPQFRAIEHDVDG